MLYPQFQAPSGGTYEEPMTSHDEDPKTVQPATGADGGETLHHEKATADGLGVLAPGGRPLPEYELVKLLGRGGFGEVWRAAGPGGFDVALKFIRLGGPAAQIELRSLELMKGIRHPHLLTLFGAWQRDDYLIVAMELADRTLLQRLQECVEQGLPGIPVLELLEYTDEAAEGLDYLNEGRHPSPSGTPSGVQHKDVKPQNLLLVGGSVKVADFGLVQVLEQTAVSATGGLTPAYAAPEIFAGRTTKWSDQYSLAVTYCHLRGGRLPFSGSAAKLMAGHIAQPPDLSMLPEVERDAVERALAKEPGRRWPNCRAFAEALEAAVRAVVGAGTAGKSAAALRGAEATGELKHALATTDAAAVLVSQRLLRRLLRAEFGGSYLIQEVPHENCYIFDRDVLLSHVEQDELGLEPEQLLPPLVILLARPSAEQLDAHGIDSTLLYYWRLLFHARVHVALRRRHEEGLLTPADLLARIEQIGATEFGEVRTILQQEHALPPPGDDLSVYTEFAATYLELRYFRANLLATFFPAFYDFARVDAVLAQDVDGSALFNATRLPGAPEPVVRTDTSSDESHTYYYKLLRHAERAGRGGDLVRAAIERTRAARVAPPELALDTRTNALRDLQTLTQKLQEALKLTPEEAAEWFQVLPALLDKADQGRWPVEAKLLYDLQKICHEHGRKLYTLDLVEWALSAGKRPIKRPLSLLQGVHTNNHLRGAARRLTLARVSDEDRQRLVKLLNAALHRSEERLRERVRPILGDAFHDVGLVAPAANVRLRAGTVAAGPAERVALHKMIEELLDRVTENGFFTFSDLRDTLSSNQLKLADVPDPNTFWRGDPLLRLDRRLASSMEGVYKRGEFYLRWLESGSSLLFGTAPGRFLTRNLLLPFGGAFLLITGLTFLWNHASHRADKLPLGSFLPLGVFLLGLMYIEGMRGWFVEAAKRTFRVLRSAFYEQPVRLWRRPWFQGMLRSWPVLLLYWYVLKPAAVCGLLLFLWPAHFASLTAAAIAFAVANLAMNSTLGAAAGEAAREAVALSVAWIRVDGLRGLIRVVGEFFKRVTEAVESALYTVDEWLRFRSGEGRLTVAVRAILGVLWFPFRYLFRLYFVVLIEPSLNPLKLPLSIIAAKFFVLIPNYVEVMVYHSEAQRYLIDNVLAPNVGETAAWVLTFGVIVPTLWLGPSAVAFLVWELRGNWRLFRANRPARLRPVLVGHHGETVLQLLRPGHHSGTVPRLFGQLRRAERAAYHSGDWRAARATRLALRDVAHSVRVFVEREFVTLLHQSKSWPERPVRAAQVVLSCGRIRIELGHEQYPGESVWLALEDQSGWLIAGVQETGWLKHVTEEQRRALTSALAGLYRLAGVDFVREQLAVVLAPLHRYHLTDHQLVVWTDREGGQAGAYDLRGRRQRLSYRSLTDIAPAPAPPLEARQVFFSRLPLTWKEWSECWQSDQKGESHPQVFGEGMRLLPQS